MVILPVLPNISISPSSILEIARANLPLANLVPGETLTVSVLEKIDANQYRMAVKDTSITAKSDILLKPGDTLQVKVQSVQPQIILNLTDPQKQSTDAKINEQLLQWRVHPEALPQLLSKLAFVADQIKPGRLPLTFPQKEMEGVIKLLGQIVFSSPSKTNPLVVKDFVARTGLMLETELAALVSQKAAGRAPLFADNLKASLLKLSEAMGEVLKDVNKFDASVTSRLINLSSFTSDALKTFEARQIVNVVYQQNENGLYLQIPLASGDAFRQMDVFITPDDKNADGSKRFASCAIRIFLDMDYLGELAIEAGIREGRIRCVIQCESEDIKNLIEESAPQLREALSATGYGVDQIDCLMGSDLGQKRAEFIGQQILGSTDLVNSYA